MKKRSIRGLVTDSRFISATGQIRNPNIEIRNKFEYRNSNVSNGVICAVGEPESQVSSVRDRFRFEFPSFALRICFGFRASDFGFLQEASCAS